MRLALHKLFDAPCFVWIPGTSENQVIYVSSSKLVVTGALSKK
jgi:hypothetical protein